MRFIAGLVLCLMTSSAAADFLTGNELHTYLLEGKAVVENRPGSDIRRAATGQGYIMGIVDSLNREQHPRWKTKFCIPSSATVSQVSDVVLKFLNDQPHLRHLPASNLLLLALEQAFPCAK